MNRINESVPQEFILLGFSDRPWLELPLFVVFLISYILTILGNLAIIVVSRLDSKLHTPMYFFSYQSLTLGPLLHHKYSSTNAGKHMQHQEGD